MLTDWEAWLVIVSIGAGTLLLRFSFIGLVGRVERVPEAALRVLRFVPSAVLAALTAPALFRPDGPIDLTLGNERLLAGLVAAGVAWWTRNMFFTIGAGMAVLWLLQALT